MKKIVERIQNTYEKFRELCYLRIKEKKLLTKNTSSQKNNYKVGIDIKVTVIDINS